MPMKTKACIVDIKKKFRKKYLRQPLNGRTLGDTAGKATFFNHNGVSIDDYCICSSSFLSNIVNFQVEEFIPNLSDHCPITVNVLSQYSENISSSTLRPLPFDNSYMIYIIRNPIL
jgi:hypothetical protein